MSSITGPEKIAIEHRGPLVSIQVLRGIAALAVVLYHAYIIISQPHYYHQIVFPVASRPGKFGVNLFFILSGFIIFYAHQKDIGQAGKIGRYLWRRTTRIYPLYWFLSAVYVVAALAGFGFPDFTTDAANVLSSVSLINFKQTPVLPLEQGWTLFYEIRFYAIFALLIINRRLGVAAFAIWFLYIAYCYVSGESDQINFGTVWNIHFMLGLGVFLLHDKLSVRWRYPLLALGIAGIALSASLTDFHLHPLDGGNRHVMVLLAVSLTLFVLGFILCEAPLRNHCPKALKFIGDASYSIYLAHTAAMSAVFIFARRLHLVRLIPPEMIYFIAVGVGIVGGIVAYLFIEKPMMKIIKRAPIGKRVLSAIDPAGTPGFRPPQG